MLNYTTENTQETSAEYLLNKINMYPMLIPLNIHLQEKIIVWRNIVKYVKNIYTERQLSDHEFYKHIPLDPTFHYTKIVNDSIENQCKQNNIPEKIAKGLKTYESKTPRFYTLPKVHKTGNPGRPVV